MCSVAASVQTLLHGFSEPKDAFSHAKQASMASTLLTRSPGLFSVALNVLASAYEFHILQSEQQLSGAEKPLASALQEAEAIISSLLEYAPHTWCYRILQWCVEVASCVARGQPPTPRSLEEMLHFWLQQPKMKPVLQFLNVCTRYLVISGRENECVDILVRECLSSNPELIWLITHVLSLQPGSLLPNFLERVLQLPLCADSPAFSAVGQSLEFLGHTHRGVVGESVVGVVGKVVRGEVGEGEKWARQVELLLRLGPLCQGVLSFASQDCLKLVTADKMKALVLAGSSSGEGSQKSLVSSDDDEGEVKSEDEGKTNQSTSSGRVDVEGAAVELLQVMGREAAATAISQLVQTYSFLADVAQSQEDAMEEGEIQNVSLVMVVQEGCRAVLEKLLYQLHTAAVRSLTPGPRLARGAGSEREFAVGLQCGLQDWSLMMLQPDMCGKCRGWLCAAVASVSVCSAELQAAQALASMLLHCQEPDHLVYVLSVYREVNGRYSTLAESVVGAALAVCREGAEPRHLCENLWRITVAMGTGVEQEIQKRFISALRVSLLSLSMLLWRMVEGGGDMHSVWRVLEMIGRVGVLEWSGGEYSNHCQVLTNLLASFDSLSLVRGLEAELCVGQCAAQLARWAGSHSSLKMFLLKSAVRKSMSQSVSHSTEPVGRRGRLLLSHQLPSNTTAANIAGHLQQSQTSSRSDASHSTNHLMSLLEQVARGNGDLVMSLLVDEVAPHLPSDSAPWLPGEGPRSTSLEWSLSVKQQFDRHPLFWHLLLFSTHCGCGFSLCEPIVCSLLLVLTQHWFSCRSSGGVASGRELHSSEMLVECLASARWLHPPLSYCAELFHSVTSHDLYLLMGAISNFVKVNLPELRRGSLAQLKEEGDCWTTVKGVIVRNIHKLGNAYAHFVT